MRRRAGAGIAVVLVVIAGWWLSRSGDPAARTDVDADGTRRVARDVEPPSGAVDHEGAPNGQQATDPTATASSHGEGAPTDAADPDREPTDAELEARAKELAASPATHVICDLGVPVRSSTAYLAIGGDSDLNGRMVEVVNGTAYLPLVYDLGELGDQTFDERSGVFALDGYGPSQITWSDRPGEGGKGRCTKVTAPEPGRASLTGMLTVDGSGTAAAGGWVEGCGNLAFADGNGVVHMDIVSTPCTVIAMRQDGALRTMSPPVDVVPVPGQDVVVDFTLPSQPRAGLGIRISSAEGGMLVEGVIDGGPAQAAGLEAGDLVVAIDGQAAGELPLEDFVDLVGGAAGTEVVLGIERDGVRIDLTMVRAPVPG
jgi:hypothetical protein